MEMGAAAYVAKGARPQQLISTLCDVCDGPETAAACQPHL
jgi:hypothetical protein